MKIILFFICLQTAALNAQVNIEQYRNSKGEINQKYDDHINLTTKLEKSNHSLYAIGFKYFKPFHIYGSNGFLVTKLNYGKTNSTEYLNNTFLHIRYLFKKKIRNSTPEVFFQNQNNPFGSTKHRSLIGIGLRYKKNETINGTSIINEWYKEDNSVEKFNQWRISQYITIKFKINDYNDLSSTLYVQPNIFNISDIRYFSENTFTSKISKKISYTSTLTGTFFSKSSNYKDIELYFESGLDFKF